MKMADEIEPKMPWESKTEIVAFIGLISSLLVSFGLAGAGLTAEQIAGIATLLFTIIMIVRKYGGGKIVLFG
jgi:hypothetical protein